MLARPSSSSAFVLFWVGCQPRWLHRPIGDHHAVLRLGGVFSRALLARNAYMKAGQNEFGTQEIARGLVSGVTAEVA